MSLPDFQRALSDLVMSPILRAQVAEDASAGLAAYDLSDREHRRLVALARDPGLRTGTLIHRASRLAMLSNTIPRTCRALGPRALKELVHAYWSENPPQSMLYVQEATRFADYVRARLAAGTFEHPFLREMLDTELAILTLAKEGGERVIPFRHDPDAVLQRLDAGQPLDGLEEGEFYLQITALGSGKVAMKAIPAEQGRASLAEP